MVVILVIYFSICCHILPHLATIYYYCYYIFPRVAISCHVLSHFSVLLHLQLSYHFWSRLATSTIVAVVIGIAQDNIDMYNRNMLGCNTRGIYTKTSLVVILVIYFSICCHIFPTKKSTNKLTHIRRIDETHVLLRSRNPRDQTQ